MSVIHDNRPCLLGEGPLWHPERRQLFWFDILGNRLMTREDGQQKSWDFDEHVSAAGWLDRDRLMVASETGLWDFDLKTGRREPVAALEADNPLTRSNDGRADPWGGFWIGTMSKRAEPGAGTIYRWYRGEVRELVPSITIPNTICFDSDRGRAYYADTPTRRVMRWALDPRHGWPVGAAETFLDLRAEKTNPDGAVVDTDGAVWIAEWGSSRVAVYGPDGQVRRIVDFPARHTSCPAFGGEDLTTLFCTSAQENLDDDILAREPENGMTFALANAGRGRAEHQIIL